MRSEGVILVVDDEPNTRATLGEALEPLGHELVLVATGEDAIEQLADRDVSLVLLDLKLPGVDGQAVLEKIERDRPDARVLILTAHGTAEAVLEGMKHGAVDVIHKPFSLDQIRERVRREMDPEAQHRSSEMTYQAYLRRARERIRAGDLAGAEAQVARAEQIDPNRPEGLNVAGVVRELRRDRSGAQKRYRMALNVDPGYEPARRNLDASTGDPTRRGSPDLGDEDA